MVPVRSQMARRVDNVSAFGQCASRRAERHRWLRVEGVHGATRIRRDNGLVEEHAVSVVVRELATSFLVHERHLDDLAATAFELKNRIVTGP